MTTKPITNILEDVLIGLGVSVSLVDIQNLLSIILLTIDLVWLFFKCSMSIYKHIKNKDIQGVKQDVDELKQGVEEFKDAIDDKEKK